jgi:hypothetical protein
MRARNIKPGFFENEDLASLSPYARLLFIGLWCMADREGRLEDRPKKISALIFPYEEVDIESLLSDLHFCDSLIQRYTVEGHRYIQIKNFLKHQKPHPHEPASVLPLCNDTSTTLTRLSRADVMNDDVMNDESPLLVSAPKKKHVRKQVCAYSPAFLDFWKIYPRKQEKGSAWRAWNARLKEGATSDQLILAARHYALSVVGKDQAVMKLPATLLGPGQGPGGADPIWQEWQEPRANGDGRKEESKHEKPKGDYGFRPYGYGADASDYEK